MPLQLLHRLESYLSEAGSAGPSGVRAIHEPERRTSVRGLRAALGSVVMSAPTEFHDLNGVLEALVAGARAALSAPAGRCERRSGGAGIDRGCAAGLDPLSTV